jgi:hypothetical protein
MRLTQLLQIVGSYRFQVRLARTEAMLAKSNKLLQDSKLSIQRKQQSDSDARQRSETPSDNSLTVPFETR